MHSQFLPYTLDVIDYHENCSIIGTKNKVTDFTAMAPPTQTSNPMKSRYTFIFISVILIIIAATLIWNQRHQDSATETPITPINYSDLAGRGASDNNESKNYEYMPHQFFDKEVPLPEFQKLEGNGITVAKHFKHDIQAQAENYGHSKNGIIYEDRNKVEMLLNQADEFLLYRINHGNYKTLRNEREARKQLLNQGVGSIKYGNTYTKKYPEACYYYSIYKAYESGGNSPATIGLFPAVEIEIYPCTFTQDRLYSEGGGEYVTHEGFLVISSVGLDYEFDNDYSTKLPVIGKIRRDYSLIGVGVNENAKNERERFDKMTANPGVRIWEDKEPEQ